MSFKIVSRFFNVSPKSIYMQDFCCPFHPISLSLSLYLSPTPVSRSRYLSCNLSLTLYLSLSHSHAHTHSISHSQSLALSQLSIFSYYIMIVESNKRFCTYRVLLWRGQWGFRDLWSIDTGTGTVWCLHFTRKLEPSHYIYLLPKLNSG